jgi:hypothetical protein
LKRAVEDERVLLDFAVTSNRHVEDKILDDLLIETNALREFGAAQSIELEKEVELWKPYQG